MFDVLTQSDTIYPNLTAFMESLQFITHILYQHWIRFIHAIPLIFLALVILFIALIFARFASKISRHLMRRKFYKALSVDVVSRAIGIMIFLIGVYLIFEMAGLTSMAFAVLSGTGLFGIILGIAFRDITENFLASILLSIHHPFQSGDLVEITGILGYVQGITMRVTELVTLEGNQVHIPNAIVYKNHLRNYSTNPYRRETTTIQVKAEDASLAQAVLLKTLSKQKELLENPKPSVLIESLDKSIMQVRIYFWLDSRIYDWLEVRSQVILLAKEALSNAGIALPDGSLKVLSPKEGLFIRWTRENPILQVWDESRH